VVEALWQSPSMMTLLMDEFARQLDSAEEWQMLWLSVVVAHQVMAY
jgi:hypothetical protein